ncbi:MAG TPA: VOC family protein [Ktedonobacterales bacterium]
MASRPVHFEIHADDPQRAIAFYEKVFGWTFTYAGMPMDYWLITTGPEGEAGIDGGLNARNAPKAEAGASPNAFVCTISVDDLDATLAAAEAAGSAGVAMPKGAVPGIGYLAYIFDSEGNLLGMMQRDPNASM